MPLPLTIPNEAIQQLKLLVFDFDGVFTDNTVYVDQHGVESVRCWRSDGLGIQKALALGLPCYVLSTEVNPVVSARCKKLKLPCIQGQEDKREALVNLAAERGIPLEHVAYLGNDINDLGCLEAVGLPLVVRDAYPEAVAAALYQTEKPGGFGAVREVCDWIVACRQLNQITIPQ